MSDSIARLNAALEGRYRLEREVGEGGMATVYLARDLRHNRYVALKVLRPEVAAAVGAERFLAEIETTANLQHPHILPLHDSGEADGLLYYVMPYVEGESLRNRLDRERQLPVDEAVAITKRVAEALDYAHRQSVVHRDIKPANILLHDGEPVVGDFGIALALSTAGGDRLTSTGLSLGTPRYMSPEQATGDGYVGPATDIYALGCVLYEMLAGEPPFGGSTPQAVLGKIVTGDVEPVSNHRKTVPPHVDNAVAMALEKVSADRFRSGAEFSRALSTPGFAGASGRAEQGASAARRATLVGYGVVAAAAALLSVWITSGATSGPEPTRRLSVALPEEAQLVGSRTLRLLDDGAGLLYTGPGEAGAGQRLWSFRWSSLDAAPRPLPGSDGVMHFDPSPDGREVALIAGDSLRVQSMETVISRTLLSSGANCCARWGVDGWIYFTNGEGGLSRVPEDGGAAEVLTVRDGGFRTHRWPSLVAGGRYVVFEDAGPLFGIGSRIALLDSRSGEIHDLLAGRYPTSWGELVFFTSQEGDELRVAELDGTALTGPTTIVGDLQPALTDEWARYDISAFGDLIYNTGAGPMSQGEGTPVWVTRDGTWEPISPDLGSIFRTLRLSPDERRLALSASQPAQRIYVKDLPDGPLIPLTRDGTVNYRMSWTLDGTGVYYSSNRLASGGAPDVEVFRVSADGAGEPEPVGLRSPSATLTPDSAWWIYRTSDFAADRADLMALSTAPGSEPIALVATDAAESQPALSRDGGWFAYSSDIDGVRQVYARPFPGASSRVQVSLANGHSPAWSSSTDELFYRGEDGGMWSVRYELDPRFTVVERNRLFDATGYAFELFSPHSYDVTADGERFVMTLRPDSAETMPERLMLVLNLPTALEMVRGR